MNACPSVPLLSPCVKLLRTKITVKQSTHVPTNTQFNGCVVFFWRQKGEASNLREREVDECERERGEDGRANVT